MTKYRKKPVVIEAVLWDGNKVSEVTPWISDALDKTIGTKGAIWRERDTVHIHTLEGRHRADPGDYIIRGVEGELYPCKPGIFAQTYEAVHDDPQAHGASGSPASKVTRPDEQDAPVSSIGLGAEGEQ